jgi:hypothetical protein
MFFTCQEKKIIFDDEKYIDTYVYIHTSLSRTGLDIASGVVNCTQNKRLSMKTSFKQIKFEKKILA